MVTNTSRQTGKPRSIGRGSSYVVRACSLVLAMMCIFIGVETSVVTAWSGAFPAVEIVNRSGKSDRLQRAPQFHRNTVNQLLRINFPRTPAPDQELIDGCESVASSLTHSPFARVASRCLS
jgi:hypothetical protein